MFVRSLRLLNFRNFKDLSAELDTGVNVVYGDNAQGKTNFLEAICFCATGRPIRAAGDAELVLFGERDAYLRLNFDRSGSARSIDAQIVSDGRRAAKRMAVDRVSITKTNELFGLLLVVLFSPEDLRLVKGGPAERRHYMDMQLCQLNPVYCHDLRQYYHVLKQRNALLKTLQKGFPSGAEELGVWDEQLARLGFRVCQARAAFMEQAGEYAAAFHAYLTGGTERLALSYRPNIPEADGYLEILSKGHSRDIYLGSTARGAHKDDIQFLIDGYDARGFGSQGQQRTAALAAKLAEIDLIRDCSGHEPVLLLDDVLSELDGRRQAFLTARFGMCQTVITCTGAEARLQKSGARMMHMVKGVLTNA